MAEGGREGDSTDRRDEHGCHHLPLLSPSPHKRNICPAAYTYIHTHTYITYIQTCPSPTLTSSRRLVSVSATCSRHPSGKAGPIARPQDGMDGRGASQAQARTVRLTRFNPLPPCAADARYMLSASLPALSGDQRPRCMQRADAMLDLPFPTPRWTTIAWLIHGAACLTYNATASQTRTRPSTALVVLLHLQILGGRLSGRSRPR